MLIKGVATKTNSRVSKGRVMFIKLVVCVSLGGIMDNCQVKILGKFKDTNALIKAYQSLQREYTKKCQRLKLLETQECTKHDDKNKYYDFASDIEYASTSKEISLER